MSITWCKKKLCKMDSAKAEVPRLLISWAANTWEPGADRVGWISIIFLHTKLTALVTNARSSGNMKASKVERLKAGVVEVNSVYLHFRGQTAVTEITLSTR